jgi:lipoate-protein ligase A
VGPDRQVWIDFWLPRSDPLWDDDVVRSSRWVGATWEQALQALGVEAKSVSVHEGAAERTPFASLVCFAGRGPGEVSVDGRKVVGVAQRRTRRGAWFQTTAPLDWDPDLLVEAIKSVGLVASDHLSAQALEGTATGLRAVVGGEWRRVPSSELITRCEDAVIAALAAST